MAKKFVKVSLATKFRVLFGTSVLVIIAAALAVPWYFAERLADQRVEPTASVLTQLRLNEWRNIHVKDPQAPSEVLSYYSYGGEMEGRKGPIFTKVVGAAGTSGDAAMRQALTAFRRNADQELAISRDEDDQGRSVYRCFRAVRADQECISCHSDSPNSSVHSQPGKPRTRDQFQAGQLVAVVDVTIPESPSPLMWWTRGAFVVGGGLAAFLAVILLAIITQRLVLRPLRHLRHLADKVTEGNLSVRSSIQTGDELQRLGESFNEMLQAIAAQHDKLRSVNRALDLRLSEMSEANVALFKADQIKNEFLANVSHELRTPLNSILGFADLLVEAGDERIHRYGQNISASAKNLLNMINDLLDIAKIEAGRLEVRMDKVSLIDTCQSLLSLMQPLADKRQLTLRSEIDTSLPLVTTDAARLQQVLYNLLSNAIKFTPSEGQVTLACGRVVDKKDKGPPEVFISVADTGPGIAEADRKYIFEKFHQLGAALTKETTGTGLGLTIAQDLARLLGGKLDFDSEPGHGAVFTLRIPVEPPAPPVAASGRVSTTP